MNIGDVATRSGVPAKTIRYYEEIGLIRPTRELNGYRMFSERDLVRVAFLGRARGLGFSIEDCRTLLSLYDDSRRASRDVRRIAVEQMNQIEEKIAALETMRASLAELIERCEGDDRPDCPILDGLAESVAVPAGAGHEGAADPGRRDHASGPGEARGG